MRARVLVAVLILAASGGCSTMKESLKTTPDRIDRPATDTPDMFVREDGRPNAGTPCLATLIDPRDKSTVQLVRSVPTQGDYRVAAGKYGVADTELLRIDCATGRTVGIVRGEQ
jgi:hypothetical protein